MVFRHYVGGYLFIENTLLQVPDEVGVVSKGEVGSQEDHVWKVLESLLLSLCSLSLWILIILSIIVVHFYRANCNHFFNAIVSGCFCSGCQILVFGVGHCVVVVSEVQDSFATVDCNFEGLGIC